MGRKRNSDNHKPTKRENNVVASLGYMNQHVTCFVFVFEKKTHAHIPKPLKDNSS